jgi:hypothetical protein
MPSNPSPSIATVLSAVLVVALVELLVGVLKTEIFVTVDVHRITAAERPYRDCALQYLHFATTLTTRTLLIPPRCGHILLTGGPFGVFLRDQAFKTLR